ncbi:hypothetical protein EYF80_009967 [Liparis tanakae]|uniref:Uncharacterized protein n=1 Tax=Liparis tanakae TaxID=230148 RepID=A0A4Z2IPI5_9TELE|nr:hypothetical protein EYF80_009967 [Liparis tanakae]
MEWLSISHHCHPQITEDERRRRPPVLSGPRETQRQTFRTNVLTFPADALLHKSLITKTRAENETENYSGLGRRPASPASSFSRSARRAAYPPSAVKYAAPGVNSVSFLANDNARRKAG